MKNRIIELQDEIASLEKELKIDINQFNEKVFNHRIGMTPFKIYFVSLRCEAIPYNPYESAVNFYKKFHELYEYISKLKEEHPEFTEDDIHYATMKYCVQENEQIKNYLFKIGGVIDENFIVDRANMASVAYRTLESFHFNNIISKQNLLQKKQEELEQYLINNSEHHLPEESAGEDLVTPELQVSESDSDQIHLGKIKSLINRGVKRLIKVATNVAEKEEN